MDPREELKDLIAQAREYLRYYSELGLTHIGELSAPAPTSRLTTQLTPETTITMPINKDNETELSLFGEPSLFGNTASPAAETQYANETLEDIRRDLGECQRCKLWSTRANIVFGEGNPKAELMFVGEAPGADEDATGRPFVGRAGQLLTKMIEAIGLKREDVYIANVVKSRPPGNRNPEPDEVAMCEPFLFKQIDIIKPKVIVALGKFGAQTLLRTLDPTSRLR